MSIFERLNGINVNGHTETKGVGARALTYLSWAWAWAEVKKAYPLSYYTIYEAANGCLYHTDGKTCWVKTGVTVVDGETQLEHIEYLPVMDHRNNSIPVADVTSMDVNKAVQRSLTKACARHGLGLYIYAGEDLPEGESDAKKTPPPLTPTVSVSKSETVYSPKSDIAAVMTAYGVDKEGFYDMRRTVIQAGMIEDKPSSEMNESDWRKLFAAINQYYGDAA